MITVHDVKNDVVSTRVSRVYGLGFCVQNLLRVAHAVPEIVMGRAGKTRVRASPNLKKSSLIESES